MNNKNRVIGLFTAFVIITFCSWYGSHYYAASVDTDMLTEMIDSGMTEDVQYIHKWRPDLIQIALKKPIDYKRAEYISENSPIRASIISKNGETTCSEIIYTHEERNIKQIQSTLLLKLIDNDQYEMIKLLLSCGADPDSSNSLGENALALAKSKRVVDLLKAYKLKYDHIVVSDTIKTYPSQSPDVYKYVRSNFSAN